MRALLHLLRDNEAPGDLLGELHGELQDASSHLKILDPEHGEEELVKAFEVARANLPGYELFRYKHGQKTANRSRGPGLVGD